MIQLFLLITILSNFSILILYAEEDIERTQKLKELNPLPDSTPTLEKNNLQFPENHRKGNSSRNRKSVRDSSGIVEPLEKSESPMKETSLETLKEPPKSREPLDFRRKEK